MHRTKDWERFENEVENTHYNKTTEVRVTKLTLTVNKVPAKAKSIKLTFVVLYYQADLLINC